MKKVLSILMLLVSLNGYCQSKAPLKYVNGSFRETKDSGTIKKDTLYYIVLKKEEFNNLIGTIKLIDEKPSLVNKWIEENIIKKTQLVEVPQDSTKKK